MVLTPDRKGVTSSVFFQSPIDKAKRDPGIVRNIRRVLPLTVLYRVFCPVILPGYNSHEIVP